MPNLILRNPNLWIGDRDDSIDRKWLQDKKITCVFNCTPDLIFRQEAGVTEQYRLSLHDDKDDIPKMTKRLPATVKKLVAARQKGHNILVHCRAGQQRSACLVAGYLLYMTTIQGKCWITTQDAVNFIKARRKEAFLPQVNFRKSLMAYQRMLKETYAKKKPTCKKSQVDINQVILDATKVL